MAIDWEAQRPKPERQDEMIIDPEKSTWSRIGDFFGILGAAAMIAFVVWTHRENQKLEVAVATHARAIRTITAVVNKQGKAMEAVVKEVGLDVEEITK